MDQQYNDRKRSYSRDKKDKKKKKKDQDRSRSRSHKKKKNSEKQRDYDRDRKQERDRDNEKGKEKARDKDRSKQRQKKKEKYEKQKQKDYDKDKKKDKEREKDREGQKEREKDKSKQKSKEKQKEREQTVKQPRPAKQVNQKPSESREKSVKKKKKRSESRKKTKKQKRSYERSRSKNKRKRQKSRDRKKRKDSRHRSSSSSSSEEDPGHVSDDPEQVQKLAQMKAAKELVSSKADRKLYLGNLPPNITSQQLMDMLNGALKKMEINTDVEGDSIVSAWISPDGVGHYAFVEFRTAQEATNGLTLNGASLFGYQLKLGRPKQYIEYNKTLLSEMGTDRNLQSILKKVALLGPAELPPVEERIVCPPSRIVVLKYIVSIEELAIDQEFAEIEEDVRDMAKRFGTITNIVIPRPHQTIDLELAPKRVKGLGLIFIEYASVSEAKFARSQFISKQFEGHPVACSFFDEQKYQAGDYDIQEKVIIDF